MLDGNPDGGKVGSKDAYITGGTRVVDWAQSWSKNLAVGSDDSSTVSLLKEQSTNEFAEGELNVREALHKKARRAEGNQGANGQVSLPALISSYLG